MKREWFVVALAGLSVACAASPSLTPSIADPSATAPVQAGAPPGCAPVDLHAPDGELVDLRGAWAGSGVLAIDSEEVAAFNQIGSCVFGSVTGLDGRGDEAVTNLSGHVNPDFTVAFEVVAIKAPVVAVGFMGNGLPEYRTVVMVIEWDEEGRLRLREDREHQETGDICSLTLEEHCPDPVIWYPVGEGPAS